VLVALLVWGILVMGATSEVAGEVALWWLVPVFLEVCFGRTRKSALRERERFTLSVAADAGERQILGALRLSGGLTPATAAASTSLSVTQAAEVLERLAGRGHLETSA
jgi:hypothetical protein